MYAITALAVCACKVPAHPFWYTQVQGGWRGLFLFSTCVFRPSKKTQRRERLKVALRRLRLDLSTKGISIIGIFEKTFLIPL